MTKSELIANLRENSRLSVQSDNWFKSGVMIFFLCFVLITSWYELDHPAISFAGWFALVVLVFGVVHGKRAERNIDRKTSMFCGECGKRYDEETLAYAVLVNECQSCESAIYET